MESQSNSMPYRDQNIGKSTSKTDKKKLSLQTHKQLKVFKQIHLNKFGNAINLLKALSVHV